MTDKLVNQGIQACMRLNAKLTGRVDRMRKALELLAGKTPCSGAMTHDEHGKAFSPECTEAIRIAHRNHCPRCVASRALIECTDCGRGGGEQHKPSCHRQGIVTADSDYEVSHD